MGLFKLTFLFLVLIAAWLGLKVFLRIRAITKASTSRASGHARRKQKMVKCSKCQLYLQESDAIIINGQPYCSQAHAEDDTDAQH